MEKSSVKIIAMPSNKMHKMQEYIHLLFALDNVTSRLCLYYFRWTKVTEPKWDYELPPPFRHLNGGNVGTCCADVGQNFGCFGLAAQPTRLQYLKPWDWYSGFDIVVWVLGSLCYCCCVLICSALVVGEVPGRGRSRPKHQFYVLSLGSWVFSKRF